MDRNYTIISQKVHDQYDYFLENGGRLSREAFYLLYRNYYILLEKYFESKLPLAKYEKKIRKAVFLRILPYQHSHYVFGNLSTWKYGYFRLIVFPTMHILKESDIHRLLSLNLEMLNNPDSSLLDLIERTYHSVLDLGHSKSVVQFIDHMNYDKVCFINFSIVHDEFRRSILGANYLWQMRNFAQSVFLQKIAKEMECEFSEILGTNVQIFRG